LVQAQGEAGFDNAATDGPELVIHELGGYIVIEHFKNRMGSPL
jgi:hypothetical protein